MELVDYSFSPPTVASLVAAGKRGAGRYVGAGTAGKKLTAGERDALFAAGLCIFLTCEGMADDALQGFSLGAVHGGMAVRDAQWLGAPRGVALIGNVDFDVTVGQWPACRSYMAGFAGPVRAAGYRVGLYGGYNAIDWGARDGVADIFWQTYAWSGGRWHPAAQLQQYRNGVPMGGGDVDLCRAVAVDFGQWGPPGAPTTRGHDMPGLFKTPETGETVWMSDGFKRKALSGRMWADYKETWGDTPIATCADLAALEAIAGPEWTAGAPVDLTSVEAAAEKGAKKGIEGATFDLPPATIHTA